MRLTCFILDAVDVLYLVVDLSEPNTVKDNVLNVLLLLLIILFERVKIHSQIRFIADLLIVHDPFCQPRRIKRLRLDEQVLDVGLIRFKLFRLVPELVQHLLDGVGLLGFIARRLEAFCPASRPHRTYRQHEQNNFGNFVAAHNSCFFSHVVVLASII
ncbi:MAG: hypothetical protein ACYSR4_08950 [Planctomycetota bacterium]